MKQTLKQIYGGVGFNDDGTYGSMPLHDVSICPDGKVLIKTFYNDYGNIKQPSINLDDF